jgi:putative ABC transport system permease protein
VLTAPAYLPEWKYSSDEARRAFVTRAVAELANLPAVTSAAAVNVLPLSGNNSSGAITVEGFSAPPPNQRESADRRAVTPAYFAAMHIRLLQGRAFADADNERAGGVVIVSRSLAERYWPGENPVGKRLKLARYAAPAPWLTIVGVAADVRHATLAQASRQAVYYPFAQLPGGTMEIVVRSRAAAAPIVRGVRETLQRLDPDLPVDAIRPLSDIVRTSLFTQQLELGLLSAFALLAVALAAAGVYGVMSYAVTQRIQEFAVRLAIGAASRDIVRLVAGYGLRLITGGVLLGGLGAWAGSFALSGLLYGVRPTDPIVFASTALLLAAVAMAACVVPVRRVLRLNPIAALRLQ